MLLKLCVVVLASALIVNKDKPMEYMKYSSHEIDKLWTENLDGKTERTHYNDLNPIIREYLEVNSCQGTLLDLGCGLGQMSNIFNKIGFKVIAIDRDAERISKAESRYNDIDFIHYDIEYILPFKDNSFDVIFSRSVFQYIHHEEILRECRRVLKKDGSLILLENLRNNPITKLGRGYLKLFNHNYHSYPWNHFTLSEILEVSKGLQDSSVHFYHLLSPLSYLNLLKKHYPLFYRIDQEILKIRILRKFAWLVLLTAKNSK